MKRLVITLILVAGVSEPIVATSPIAPLKAVAGIIVAGGACIAASAIAAQIIPVALWITEKMHQARR